jgi:hypothetical protein
MSAASRIAIARRLLFVRETEGQNSGKWVGFFQRYSGGQDGDAWCSDFISFVMDVDERGATTYPRTGSTKQLLAAARHKGLVIDAPEIGCLFFYVYETTREPHHVGIVTSVDPLIGLAGNTSQSGVSSEGTGVFEHAISTTNTVFARVP